MTFIHNTDIKRLNTYRQEINRMRHYGIRGTSDGQMFPSITTVLGHTANKEWLQSWRKAVGDNEADRVSNISARNGTILHEACEDYLNNKKVNLMRMMPIPRSNFVKMKKWLDENINEVYLQEAGLISNKLKVAGSVDLIASVNEELSVVDFKTSKTVKKEEDIEDYFLQCAFYALAFQEVYGIPISTLYVVIAVEGKPIQVFKRKTVDYIKPLVERVNSFYKEYLISANLI